MFLTNNGCKPIVLLALASRMVPIQVDMFVYRNNNAINPNADGVPYGFWQPQGVSYLGGPTCVVKDAGYSGGGINHPLSQRTIPVNNCEAEQSSMQTEL